MKENSWNTFSTTISIETLAKQEDLWQTLTKDDASLLSYFDEANSIKWYKYDGPFETGTVLKCKLKGHLLPLDLHLVDVKKNSDLTIQIKGFFPIPYKAQYSIKLAPIEENKLCFITKFTVRSVFAFIFRKNDEKFKRAVKKYMKKSEQLLGVPSIDIDENVDLEISDSKKFKILSFLHFLFFLSLIAFFLSFIIKIIVS